MDVSHHSIIDAHVHVVSAARARRNAEEGGPERLSRAHGIDELWAAQPYRIPVVLMESDRPTPDENVRLLAIAEQNPDVIAVIGRLDLSASDAADEVARLTSGPAGDRWRGPRHVLRRDLDDRWDTRAERVTGLLGEMGRVLEILTPWDLIDEAVSIATSTSCTVVVDHLALPPWDGDDDEWRAWERGIAQLAAIGHVVTKLSHVPIAGQDSRLAARVKRAQRLALDGFGPARIMYASNWPWPAPGPRDDEDYPLARALSLAKTLDAKAATRLLGGTARIVYGGAIP